MFDRERRALPAASSSSSRTLGVMEMETFSFRCPIKSPFTVGAFNTYSYLPEVPWRRVQRSSLRRRRPASGGQGSICPAPLSRRNLRRPSIAARRPFQSLQGLGLFKIVESCWELLEPPLRTLESRYYYCRGFRKTRFHVCTVWWRLRSNRIGLQPARRTPSLPRPTP